MAVVLDVSGRYCGSKLEKLHLKIIDSHNINHYNYILT